MQSEKDIGAQLTSQQSAEWRTNWWRLQGDIICSVFLPLDPILIICLFIYLFVYFLCLILLHEKHNLHKNKRHQACGLSGRVWPGADSFTGKKSLFFSFDVTLESHACALRAWVLYPLGPQGENPRCSKLDASH